MTDGEIIKRIEAAGISVARLRAALDTKEPWGRMVHAFEYLTVLGIVEDAMIAAEAERTESSIELTEC